MVTQGCIALVGLGIIADNLINVATFLDHRADA
jgi:hypothetical protein